MAGQLSLQAGSGQQSRDTPSLHSRGIRSSRAYRSGRPGRRDRDYGDESLLGKPEDSLLQDRMPRGISMPGQIDAGRRPPAAAGGL